MANTRISDLTASASNLASTDLAPVVQTAGVGPVKMTGLQLAGGLLGSTTFNGSTVTTSSPVLNLTQTWNAGAVTFTGLKFNATDTASASGSLLLDLQVGGASKLSIDKSGSLIIPKGSSTSASIQFTGTANSGIYCRATSQIDFLQGGNIKLEVNGNAVVINNTSLTFNANVVTNPDDCCMTRGGAGSFKFGNDTSYTTNFFLTASAAATLQLGAADAAAPAAQTFKVQSVVGSTPGASDVAGANFTIQGSAGRGSGAGGSIIFQVAPAGSAGTGAQNAYSTALTIASNRDATFTGNIFIPAGGTIGNGVNVLAIGSGNIYPANAGLTVGTAAVPFTSLFVTTNVAWSSGGTADTILTRDAANTLALRNGGTSGTPVPQTFRVYAFYADASNYKRLALLSSPYGDNRVEIKAESAGTGGTSDLSLASANGQLYFVTNSSTCWRMDTSGHFLAAADNTYDIGASGTTNRVRTFYSGGGYSAAAPTIKTGNYSQGIHDYSLIFNGSGSITLTLLAAATYPGKILYVKTIAAQTVVSASSNVKPIDTDTAGTAILAATAGKWAMLQSDGTNWVIMAQG